MRKDERRRDQESKPGILKEGMRRDQDERRREKTREDKRRREKTKENERR
jgi:hypothetical protein